MHARAKNLWSLYAPGIHIGLFEHSYLSNIPSQLIVPERGTTFVKIDCQPSILQMFLSTIHPSVTFQWIWSTRLVAFELAISRKKINPPFDNCGLVRFVRELSRREGGWTSNTGETSVKIFVEKFRKLNPKGANTFESKNPRELLLREFFASGNYAENDLSNGSDFQVQISRISLFLSSFFLTLWKIYSCTLSNLISHQMQHAQPSPSTRFYTVDFYYMFVSAANISIISIYL